MKTLYTIGHSNNTTEKFLSLLRENGIDCVVDVRSTPYSEFHSQFNKPNIQNLFTQNKIKYIHMPEEFGARIENPKLYTNGYVDFSKVRKGEAFKKGVSRVQDGIDKGYTIALLCCERQPIDCHRNILVAKAFYDLGYEILNIVDSNIVITQKEVEQMLLDLYFKNRNQLSLLEETKPETELINEAYQLRSKAIAYETERVVI